MVDDKYLEEQPLYEVDDYGNELFIIRIGISARLQKMGIIKLPDEDLTNFWSRVEDESFLKAMIDRRYKVQTIEERFMAGEPCEEYENLIASWKDRSPLRMAGSNQLVEVLNTTEQPAAFKLAFFKIDASPTDALRATLGEGITQKSVPLMQRSDQG